MNEYRKSGIEVIEPYTSGATSIQLGKFNISFFDLVHDVPTYGAYVEEGSMGKLVFCTDTSYVKYRFPGVNHILCECSYAVDLLNQNYEHSLRDRVLQTHMSLQTTLNFLAANNSPELRNTILCHLSEINADSEEFKRQAEKVVDCPVWIARKGLVVPLNLIPF